MIQITTNNFLNSILADENGSYINIRNLAEKYKSLVSSELDKWFYNQLVTENKFETSFNPSTYQSNVFSTNVPLCGKANTDYGEFIRAFNKLAYRWFNDGDCPMSGPYSALNYFMKDTKGSRKFGWDVEEFKLVDHSSVVFGDQYDLESDYEGRFNDLLQCICKGPMIWEASHITTRSSSVEEWCSSFIVLIDQLHDDIKGMNECYESCDKYFKNALEFHYPGIYNWLCETFNNHRWQDLEDNSFENWDEEVDIFVRSSDTFSIRFSVPVVNALERTNEINVYVNEPFDKDFLETLKKFYKLATQKYSKEKSEFVTVSEYLKYFNHCELDRMLIVKENEKIILKTQTK